MSQRTHNIFFHLHTVCGIVISFGLYIIFFAGAFTMYVEPIEHWEQGKYLEGSGHEKNIYIDYNRMMDSLVAKDYDLYSRSIYSAENGENYQNITIGAVQDSLTNKAIKERIQLKFDTTTYEISEDPGAFSLGDLLYQLHFYYQLDLPGYYLSGLVSLFFLFAIVTGIIVHWKKIVTNFYTFRPLAKLKTIWTDAHTVLGVIGIPFQFMYALTGAMFGLGILVTLSGSVLYGGDKEKFYEVMYHKHEDPIVKPADVTSYDYNAYRDSINAHWPGYRGKYFSIEHYGTTAQQFGAYGYIDPKDQFLNDGEVAFDMATGRVVEEHSPFGKKYSDNVMSTVYRLHFGDYGEIGTWTNYLLKFIYFVMAIITCFVIMSGVLIWLTARDKKNISEKKRRYNEGVGHIYLAICLTMLPITAFSFIVSKLLPESVNSEREVILNSVYFGGWLLLSIFFWLKRNNYFTNKYTLLSGGILGLLIPIINGVSSGNWIWRTFTNQNYDAFMIDMLWVFIGLISLYVVYRLKTKKAPAPVL